MRTKLTLVVVSGLVVAAMASSTSLANRASQSKAASAASGTLNIGVVDDNPPFSFTSPKGQLEGYDIYIATQLAHALGKTPHFVRVDGAGRIAGLQTKQLDITVADLSVTPDRAQVISFSSPYLISHNVLLVKKSDSQLKTLGDMNQSGISIGTPLGATSTPQLQAEFPKAKVLVYTSISDILQALSSGHIQAIVFDDVGALTFLQQNPQDKELPGHLTGSVEKIAVGTQHGDTQTLAAVNKWINHFNSSGTNAAEFKKWFKAKLPSLKG